jgi:carbon monoxide dehydrogenase subunit G
MNLSATYLFDAPVERVWDLLMDTATVGGCLPGSRGLRPLGGDRYEVDLSVAVAAVSGDFRGTIALEDKAPPRSYKLLFEGTGRPGFVRGHAIVTLAREGEQTSVGITAQAAVGGMIARVGQRLLDGVARMILDRFFGCLAQQVRS